MKADLRKLVCLNQLPHTLADDVRFHRLTTASRDDEVVVVVLCTQLLNQQILLHFPLRQVFSNRLGKKNFPDAGPRFRLFQNQHGFVLQADFGECGQHVLTVGSLHAALVDALELLVDDNVGFSRRNALFRNVYAIPRQSEQFTNAQRAGKRQIQAQFQSLIFTAVNRVEQRLRIPDVALLHFVFREGCKLGRVLFDEFPFLRLFESAVQKIVDFANRRRLHKLPSLAILLVRHQGNRGRFQQSLIEHFQHPRRNFFQPKFAEFGGNVVPNQPGV